MSDLSSVPPAPERLPARDEPLGLTVHAMPAPADAMAQDAQRTRSGRWKMLLLALVCAAPVLASYFMYYVVRPEGRTNYGELIDPQRPLPAWSGVDAHGRTVPLNTLKNQWLLVSVADSVPRRPTRSRSVLFDSNAARRSLNLLHTSAPQGRTPGVFTPAVVQG